MAIFRPHPPGTPVFSDKGPLLYTYYFAHRVSYFRVMAILVGVRDLGGVRR